LEEEFKSFRFDSFSEEDEEANGPMSTGLESLINEVEEKEPTTPPEIQLEPNEPNELGVGGENDHESDQNLAMDLEEVTKPQVNVVGKEKRLSWFRRISRRGKKKSKGEKKGKKKEGKKEAKKRKTKEKGSKKRASEDIDAQVEIGLPTPTPLPQNPDKAEEQKQSIPSFTPTPNRVTKKIINGIQITETNDVVRLERGYFVLLFLPYRFLFQPKIILNEQKLHKNFYPQKHLTFNTWEH